MGQFAVIGVLTLAAVLTGWALAEFRDRRRPKLTDVMRAVGDPEDEA